VTQASHVDHLFAWAAIGHQAFTRNVFQSLCPECHGIKSGLEKLGVYRHYVNPAKDYALGDYALTLMSVSTHL
jgi:5-methylcytosine-specific restriction endonuclease McrA